MFWAKDKVNGEYRPTMYPGASDDDWELPEGVATDMHRLNSMIESKYGREFLKICAFYNKMFPSLKSSDRTSTSYNVPPFTARDQERTDTGFGTNFNYLKQIVDQITSRLGTINFVPMLMSEDQSYEYIVYKDEVERVLRMFIRNDDFNRQCLEAFHNAAVLGYSHVFIDPWTGQLVKANDYEIGIFEAQLNRRVVKQMLFRDYAYPTVDALKYVVGLPEKEEQEMLESLSGKTCVDLKLYFDCTEGKAHAIIDNKAMPPKDYPFEKVLVETFQWDVGFSRSLGSSLFDGLYPMQREVNRIAAKQMQLIRLYKGSVPVFTSDVDLAMKSITNGTGEVLFVDSTRPVDSMCTVINPTPLDPQLSAEMQNYKGAMYELAGIQNASFDMENMRSAAAVVALDQTRDSVFQAQLSGLANFIKGAMTLLIKFFAECPQVTTDRAEVDWKSIDNLLSRSYINMQPVHLNDPLSDEEQAKQQPIDYAKLALARVTLGIIKGEITFDNLPYYMDATQVTISVASVMLKFEALGIKIPDSVHVFMVHSFLNDVKTGNVSLVPEEMI